MSEHTADYDARRARWLAAADVVHGTVLSTAEGRILDNVRGSVVQVFVPDTRVTPPGLGQP